MEIVMGIGNEMEKHIKMEKSDSDWIRRWIGRRRGRERATLVAGLGL
jgi:hypothetical protein